MKISLSSKIVEEVGRGLKVVELFPIYQNIQEKPYTWPTTSRFGVYVGFCFAIFYFVFFCFVYNYIVSILCHERKISFFEDQEMKNELLHKKARFSKQISSTTAST